MGVGILISSYHCTWEFWYLLTIVHTQRLSEVPRGWDFFISSYHCTHSRSIWSSTGVEILISSYHCTHSRSIWSSMGVGILISSEHCTHSKVNWKFHGRAFFHIFFRPLYTLKGEFEVPWGWEFWYLPTIVHSKVNVKFHGGGNFDVFLITIAPTQRSIWRSMKVEILVSSYRCANWRSIWSFMGVGILISSYHCTLKGQVEVPWRWEIWYLLTGVHTQCQFEVPWGWDFFYIFLPLYTFKGLSEVPRGGIFDIFLPLYTFKVNLKFHGGGIWISSYPCTHSRSIWSSWGFPRVGMRS